MKLTTRTPKDRSFTQVHGGRIVRTLIELAVPRDGVPEEVFGKEHKAPNGLIATRVGDLAVEIVNHITTTVIGHYFLSGPALGIIRYAEGTNPRHYEISPNAVRVNLDPAQAHIVREMEEKLARRDDSPSDWFSNCMLELTHRYELAYFGNMHVLDLTTMRSAGASIPTIYSINDETRTKTCHLIGSLHMPPASKAERIQGHQPVSFIHCQPAKDKSDRCCSPFGHELLDTADLRDVDFWKLDTQPTTLAEELLS